jgi:hypothetical protein
MKAPLATNIGLDRLRRIADAAGMLASGMCLVHCLALPLLVALFPLPGIRGDSDTFHIAMVGVAIVAALLALAPGYRMHRRVMVAAAGASGLACLASAAFLVGPRYGETAETCMTVMGAALISIAHLRNRACCRARGVAR